MLHIFTAKPYNELISKEINVIYDNNLNVHSITSVDSQLLNCTNSETL